MRDALQMLINRRKGMAHFELMLQRVCDYYKYSEADILGKSREQPLALVRQTVMYLSTELNTFSLKEVAGFLDRDHTTVMHGANLVRALLIQDAEFRKQVNEIRQLCHSDYQYIKDELCPATRLRKTKIGVLPTKANDKPMLQNQ